MRGTDRHCSRPPSTRMKTTTDRPPRRNWLATCGTTTSSTMSPDPGHGIRLMMVLRPNEATEIFFIGIGNAFYGVANLLINRGMFSFSREHVKGRGLTLSDSVNRNAVSAHQRGYLFRCRESRPSHLVTHPALAIQMVQRRESRCSLTLLFLCLEKS